MSNFDMIVPHPLIGSRVFDVSQPLRVGIPQRPRDPAYFLLPYLRHGDEVRSGGISIASELIQMRGHLGTHIDALGHVSVNGRLYGGIEAAAAQGPSGMKVYGAETIPLLLRRFILLDVAHHRGVGRLPPETPVEAADLEASLGACGLSFAEGDVALVRTGWGELWDQPPEYDPPGSVPGITLGAARWLADRGVAAIGGDTMAVEYMNEARGLPVHAFCLAERGTYLIENLNLEPLSAEEIRTGIILVLPLKLEGATGSPVRAVCLAWD